MKMQIWMQRYKDAIYRRACFSPVDVDVDVVVDVAVEEVAGRCRCRCRCIVDVGAGKVEAKSDGYV
jgi:hypothetical protein